MEQADGIKILNKIDQLVDYTNYDLLLEYCVSEQLILADMVENFDDDKRHHQLIGKITQGGPDAFGLFTKILKQHFPQAYEVLQNKNQIDGGCITKQTENDEKLALEIYTKPLSPKLKFKVKKATKFGNCKQIGAYKMNSTHRGVLLYVNIINTKCGKPRNGAQFDRENVLYLFKQMGFDLIYYEDITANQFKELVDELITSDYLSRADCLVLSIMSHGARKDNLLRVQFGDGKKLYVEDDIISKFNNENCRSLIGKPKIFIFPFCRGDQHDQGVLRRGMIETDAISFAPDEWVPTYSDILLCYGTYPGYVSYRNPHEGSYFVLSMCKIWPKNMHTTCLEKLIKMMQKDLKKSRDSDGYKGQLVTMENRGLDKALYFNPGLYLQLKENGRKPWHRKCVQQ